MHAERPLGRLAAVAIVAAAGCMPLMAPPAQQSPTPPPELPPLPVEQLTTEILAPTPPVAYTDPLVGAPGGETVTLSAVDVDVRALLTALAEAAELSLVMGPEVIGRVTVNLVDVPAIEALRVVLAEADLMIAPAPLLAPWGPAVFYALPVDIGVAGPELIRARFEISAEMAAWIVESRLPR